MLGSDVALAFNVVELLWAQRQKGIFFLSKCTAGTAETKGEIIH